MRKILIYTSIFIFGIFAILLSGIRFYESDFYKRHQLKEKGIYAFVSTSDKDDFYENLLFLRNEIGDKEFDSFIKLILNSGANDFTQYFIVPYVREENKKEFICDLISLQAVLYKDKKLNDNNAIYSDVDNTIKKLCDENKSDSCCIVVVSQ